jgi:hypothetical protein
VAFELSNEGQIDPQDGATSFLERFEPNVVASPLPDCRGEHWKSYSEVMCYISCLTCGFGGGTFARLVTALLAAPLRTRTDVSNDALA